MIKLQNIECRDIKKSSCLKSNTGDVQKNKNNDTLLTEQI